MPRQTTGEIDSEIVDRAASLFSRHGFGRTSLQQVADAVGYTKAGLLHHFPSKQAIYDAVVAVVTQQLSNLADSVEALPVGYARDLTVVTSMVNLATDWPGVSEFANSLVHDGHDLGAELAQGGLALLGAFGVDLENPDDERLIRIVSTCTGLTMTTLQASRAGLTREWRELVITVSMDTLGHSARPSG
ncbi:helix-turn-helix domain-containing protein [Streptosporangium longisporum]|uniref:HTH tetR-type domain-containing protein n=1 Tax=Streptosporangium longisporum TaxID=46187 RepID=A0ABP6K6J5_9ACTN